MTDLRQAAMLALEAINLYQGNEHCEDAFLAAGDALRTALEQPEREPVGYDKTELNRFVQDLYDEKMQKGKHGHYETMFHVVHQAIKKVAPPAAQWDKPSVSFNEWWDSDHADPANPFTEGSPAYWAWAGWKAAQRKWQGLTEGERNDLEDHCEMTIGKTAFDAIEAKLKERNNG
jgi:hypothetical protein